MRTLAFLSQKGGSGKTTLAVHTAVAAQEDGERVVIVDTDLQKSATTWSDARQADTPAVAPVAAAALNDVMKASRHDAMTPCIIDTAPHAAPDAARVASLADLVVIPAGRPPSTSPPPAAPSKSSRPLKLARCSSCPPARCGPRKSPRPARCSKATGFAPVTISERRAFARAVASGKAVTEFKGEGKAAAEIRALWNWFREQMKHGKNKDHRVSSVHESRKRVHRA
jgi:chromosome partitioning protein